MPNRTTMPLPHGVILAGGRGTRLARGPKHAVLLGGSTLLARARARIAPQVAALALNINDEIPPEARDLVILRDRDESRGGPMMGILAGLEWAAGEGAEMLMTVPVDAPFLPGDLVRRLCEGANGAAALAACADTAINVCALWPVAVLDSVRSLVVDTGVRRVRDVLDALDATRVHFSDAEAKRFLNINTAEDLERAEAVLAAGAL